MHIHLHIGIGLRQQAAHILAQLDAGQGEALVAALGLHLEASDPLHVLAKIFYGKGGNGVPVLFAGGGPAQFDDAEDLFQRLKRGVHVRPVLLRLHIHRGLEAVDPELADGLQSSAHIAHQLLFKGFPVETLEHDLAQLE